MPVAARGIPQPTEQFLAQRVGLDDPVEDEIGGQAFEVDVLLVFRAAFRDVRGPFVRVGDRGDLVGVDGVDRRLGAKVFASEAAVNATRIAAQVFGGNGFMEEFPVARFFRDAKILEIGEGTSEVQRMLIARGLGLTA